MQRIAKTLPGIGKLADIKGFLTWLVQGSVLIRLWIMWGREIEEDAICLCTAREKCGI